MKDKSFFEVERGIELECLEPDRNVYRFSW